MKIVRAHNKNLDRYADFSECGTYRYALKIRISSPLRWQMPALFIMLNPSTADEMKNDPTVSRCISFAKENGCTELTVVNLFALRATDPRKLSKHKNPVGPLNDTVLEDAILTTKNMGGIVVAAWGANPMAQERGEELLGKFKHVFCLGKTKGGAPRHPLYVKSNTKLEEIR